MNLVENLLYDKLLKSRRNIIEIAQMNNYISTSEDNTCDDSIIRTKLDKYELDMEFKHQQTNQRIIVHYYVYKENMNTRDIPDIYNNISAKYAGTNNPLTNNDILWIIYNTPKTEQVNDNIKICLIEFWNKSNILINVSSLLQTGVNILNHSYVPKYTILSSEESNDLIQRYKIDKDPITQIYKMPCLLRFDAIAPNIFIKPGQICKVESKHDIGNITYRVCINK